LYGGLYLSRGGDGSSDGGPGTIYKYESQRGLNFIKLVIDTVIFHHHGWVVCFHNSVVN
jgi:hypothetical protein